ncbi:hypothetical protein EYZ11_012200 [Aspergillus tanneri]|uniref:Uncharacterized protein n=1 Tax=Aspergillus tanneri TaxID=1220188 RepID=A0A4V3UMR7_9EURO|nr:hypothetical protein EYZ11_012200 [Aspergillus tanneri]
MTLNNFWNPKSLFFFCTQNIAL